MLKANVLGLCLVVFSLGLFGQETFDFEGAERTYYLDLPGDVSDDTPLIFVMHGFGSSAWWIRAFTDWVDMTSSEGFAVCFPQGSLDSEGVVQWNVFGQTGFDDHGYLYALASHLQETHGLSGDCTFACGESNGGMMAYSLACQGEGTFRAFASVGGGMGILDFLQCAPESPASFLHVHGTEDDVLPYGGSLLTAGVQESMELWAQLMNAPLEETLTLPNVEAEDLTSTDYIRRFGGPDSLEFRHYRVNGGGHVWFGEMGEADIACTPLIWEFFQGECVTSESTDVAEWGHPVADQVHLFPTVVDRSQPISVEWTNGPEVPQEWSVFNVLGKQVDCGSWTPGQSQITLDHLRSGVHVLRFSASGASARFWVR